MKVVEASRSIVTDVVAECRSCQWWANDGRPAAIAARARRHCATTGHQVGVSRTRVIVLRAVR